MTRAAAGRPARRTTGRSRRRGRGAGTTVAVAAAGLIVLSGPGAALGAQVSASRTVPVPAAPAPVRVADAPVVRVVAPEPVVPVPPSPAPAVAVPVPRPAAIDLRPAVPVGRPPETELRPDLCGGFVTPRRIIPAVAPGPGAARVTWQADERTEVTGYRVQAVRQPWAGGRQPEPPVRLADQPGGCAPVEVLFDGLVPGATYVFWLEEQVQDTYSARWVQVGTSHPVVIG